MKRGLTCPFSLWDYPDDQSGSDASALGTELHNAAAAHLTLGTPLFGNEEFVRPYVDYVKSLEGERHVEIQLRSKILPDDFFGTVDCLIVTPTRLHVIDLKTGKWRVPAKENHQLFSYLILARDTFGPRAEYMASIVQPQAYAKPNVSPVITDEQLTVFYQAVQLASRSHEKNTGDHCRFCALRSIGRCPEGARHAGINNWPA
jgi:hypothetical protein